MDVNFLDIGILLLLLVFFMRGFMRGLVQEVAELAGLFLAFTFARRFQNQMYDLLVPMFGGEEWTYLLAYALIFALVILGVSLLASGIRRLIAVSVAAWLDRILGAGMGLAKGLLLATVVFYLLLWLMPNAPLVTTAQCSPLFDAMVAYLQNFLPSSLADTVPVLRG